MKMAFPQMGRIDTQVNPTVVPSSYAYFPARFHDFLATRLGRFFILAIVACFGFPSFFEITPDVGLDPSWQLSLQLATTNGKLFGRDFVFTYGPLGWLLVRIGVSKAGLLFYDFFIMGSLLSIYTELLPKRVRPLDAILVITLAMVTKWGLVVGSAALLNTIFCYWLWCFYDRGNKFSLLCTLISGVILFFGKVNYGLLVFFLIPAYSVEMMALCKNRRISAFFLLVGFLFLALLGTIILHVNLRGYLRSGLELIAGYNDAMFTYPSIYSFGFELACLFLLAMAFAAFYGRNSLAWSEKIMIFPLVGLASFLLFKNGFVRSDEGHNQIFYFDLPLLLAVWCIASRYQKLVKLLLLASIFYPVTLLFGRMDYIDRDKLMSCTPLKYLRQAYIVSHCQNSHELQSVLRARFPEAVIPDSMRTILGNSSVDVMPWESSIAVLNGLALRQRPVPQSYSAYTPWLDNINARFLESHDSPDFLLYACAQSSAIDERPAVWDESITKRALLENYSYISQFYMPLKCSSSQKFECTPVFILKHEPSVNRLILVSTNEVTIALNQKLQLPKTTNLLFLKLNVQYTFLGQLVAFVLSPRLLTVSFEYEDGELKNYRAILPILKTGVLVNRRVELPYEIRNWLRHTTDQNMAVDSISFKSSSSWAFKNEIKGSLAEYRIIQNTNIP